MKKYLAVFGLLVLVGFGCSNSPAPENTTETKSENADVEMTDNSSNKSNAPEISGTVPLKDLPTVEDGVQIIDVVLGDKTQQISMESGNYFFKPDVINASPGEKIELKFKNSGFHTFVIDEINAKYSIKDGETFIFTAPTEPGSYSYYCDIGSHRKFGQEGTLIVK